MLQRIFNFDRNPSGENGAGAATTLAELRTGAEAIVGRLDVPDDVARRLMELGFLPGNAVAVAHSAPGGDPRVFRVDGSEIALRRETALHIHLQK